MKKNMLQRQQQQDTPSLSSAMAMETTNENHQQKPIRNFRKNLQTYYKIHMNPMTETMPQTSTPQYVDNNRPTSSQTECKWTKVCFDAYKTTFFSSTQNSLVVLLLHNSSKVKTPILFPKLHEYHK